jgi:hypothetical protein
MQLAIYGHGAPFRKSRGYETMIPLDDGWSNAANMRKWSKYTSYEVMAHWLTPPRPLPGIRPICSSGLPGTLSSASQAVCGMVRVVPQQGRRRQHDREQWHLWPCHPERSGSGQEPRAQQGADDRRGIV